MRAYRFTWELRPLCALCLALTVLSAGFGDVSSASGIDKSGPRTPGLNESQRNASYARLPLSIEVNQGQADRSVKYTGGYPGVDLIYYGNQRRLEYDFVSLPYSVPSRLAG